MDEILSFLSSYWFQVFALIVGVASLINLKRKSS